jgi:NADH-quinone oxidoreductase subunit A
MTTPTMIGAYLALFYCVGFLFLFANLLLGRFLRPKDPHAEKTEIYECGEPTIGSSYVQFDLRFYVVALLFIIFDVEVAFFFPWATVFGKTTNLAATSVELVEPVRTASGGQILAFTPAAKATFQELGVPAAATASYLAAGDANSSIERRAAAATDKVKADARSLALLSLADIGVFFAVLMVGFAYVWKRGDLDWVRAVSRQRAGPGRENARDLELVNS